MNDNIIRYRTIHQTLNRLFGFPIGNQARRLSIFATMINGIIASGHVALYKIAESENKDTDAESKIKQKTRFLQNENVTFDLFYLPYIKVFLMGLAQGGELTFSMDGSTVGRGCMCLMISVKYKNRAIPIVWLVVEGKKGHLPEKLHIELLETLVNIVPQGVRCIFLGDGEFDGCDLQGLLKHLKWEYVLRTGSNILIVSEDSEEFKLANLDPGKDDYLFFQNVKFSAKRFGPVNVIVWHCKKYKDPIYLLTNMELAEQACKYYQRRFLIETLFSDQKSRGFHIHKSHISSPERLEKLLLATCMAYIWMVLLGQKCLKSKYYSKVHRKDRCDLSLFSLGLRFFNFLINNRIPIKLLPFEINFKSVR